MSAPDKDATKRGRAAAPPKSGTKPRATRSASRTRENIIKVATKEFASKGLEGARVDTIALRSGSNKNMIYHYFGSKDALFKAVLEAMYSTIRTYQERLEVDELGPEEGIRELVEMTFEAFAKHPEFISLLSSENLAKAVHVRRSPRILNMYNPLTAAIDKILAKGVKQGVFRADLDAVDLYISISALANYHISNRYTLSALFGCDVNAPGNRARRRDNAVEMVVRYVRV